MPLSAKTSHSLFKSVTFDLVRQKLLFFFCWKIQSFNIMNNQKLMSAIFSCFQINNFWLCLWITMKTCSSTNIFPANTTRYFSQLLKTTLMSETRILEYLFEFSSNNSKINCKTAFEIQVLSTMSVKCQHKFRIYFTLTMRWQIKLPKI